MCCLSLPHTEGEEVGGEEPLQWVLVFLLDWFVSHWHHIMKQVCETGIYCNISTNFHLLLVRLKLGIHMLYGVQAKTAHCDSMTWESVCHVLQMVPQMMTVEIFLCVKSYSKSFRWRLKKWSWWASFTLLRIFGYACKSLYKFLCDNDSYNCPISGSSLMSFLYVLWSLQLDLRNGAKKSLQASPRHSLRLMTCAISPTQPHFLLIGGR